MSGLSLRERVAASRAKTAEKNAGRNRAYKFKVGKTVVRLLPGVSDPLAYSHPIGRHFIKAPGTNQTIAAVGDRSIITDGTETCPIRSALEKALMAAKRTSNKDLEDHWKDCLAYPAQAMQVSVLSDPTVNSADPQIIEVSDNLFDQFNSAVQDFLDANPENEALVFDPSERGLTLIVERTGTTKTDTKYVVRASLKGFALPAGILEKRVALGDYARSELTNERLTRAIEAVNQVTGFTVGGPISAAALTAPTTAKVGGDLDLPAMPTAAAIAAAAIPAVGTEEPVRATPASPAPAVTAVATPAPTVATAPAVATPAVAATVPASSPSQVDAILAQIENL